MNKEAQVTKIFSEKKESEKEQKTIIRSASDQVNEIKNVLNIKEVDITYLGSSQFKSRQG